MKKSPPKLRVTDITDRPELIAAAESKEFDSPRGGWVGGRFLVDSKSLAQYLGLPCKFELAPARNRGGRRYH